MLQDHYLGAYKARRKADSKLPSYITPETGQGEAIAPKVVESPTEPIKAPEKALYEEALKYKTADEFSKDYEVLYHGGSEKIIGDKLSLGGRVVGEVTAETLGKGQDYGGIFFTPEKELAHTFAGHASSGRGAVHKFVVKKDKVFDRDIAKHRVALQNFIGKQYTNVDGEKETFTDQHYDFMFPKSEDGKRYIDWATMDPQVLEELGFEGAKVVEHFSSYGKGKHLYTTVLFKGGKESPHWKIQEGQQLTDIYNKAQEGKAPKKAKIEEIEVVPVEEETKDGVPTISLDKYTFKGYSTHYNKIKDKFGFEGEVEIDTITLKDQEKKAFDYAQKNPQRAMQIAYGIVKAPPSVFPDAIRSVVMQALIEDGKIAQAEDVARRMSKSFTEAAQTLNIAKLNVSSSTKIRHNITKSRIETIGAKLGDVKNPKQAVEQKVKKESKQRAIKVNKEISSDKTTIQQIDSLIKELIC